MTSTKLLYLEDFKTLSFEAVVVDVVDEDGKSVVVLDQTYFYPQGGGQPYDQGFMESPTAKFLVEEVRYIEGIVKHIGKFESGTFAMGDAVTGKIDEQRRVLHCRLHSGGHVVDIAIHKLGLNWTPVKGFHFPQGSYVEYKGLLVEADREKLKADIARVANEFIIEAKETKLLFMPKEKMKTVCYFVPDYLPEGKPARVVMYGEYGIPCGGTHIGNVSEIKGITIPKLKMEGENIRVRYEVAT